MEGNVGGGQCLFPITLTGQCDFMEGSDPSASTGDECEAACCNDPTCTTWQFSAVMYVPAIKRNGCFLGTNNYDYLKGHCADQNDDTWDWVGGTGRGVPTGVPTGAPTYGGGDHGHFSGEAIAFLVIFSFLFLGGCFYTRCGTRTRAFYFPLNPLKWFRRDAGNDADPINGDRQYGGEVTNPVSSTPYPLQQTPVVAQRLSEAGSVGSAVQTAAYPTAPPIAAASVELADTIPERHIVPFGKSGY